MYWLTAHLVVLMLLITILTMVLLMVYHSTFCYISDNCQLTISLCESILSTWETTQTSFGHNCGKCCQWPILINFYIILVLKAGLAKNFSNVEVEVVDCPDLREKPWTLAAPGMFIHWYLNYKFFKTKLKSFWTNYLRNCNLIQQHKGICGRTRIADVGGPPYLIPLPNLSKVHVQQSV